MTSTLPSELMLTRPFALRMQFAVTAPDERTMLNVVFCATALKLAHASRSPIARTLLNFFISIAPFVECVA
jgi:hypothetical protein